MNYTLKQLQDRVNSMIKEQGEDAECAAWIYTKEDIHVKDENGEVDYDSEVNDPALVAQTEAKKSNVIQKANLPDFYEFLMMHTSVESGEPKRIIYPLSFARVITSGPNLKAWHKELSQLGMHWFTSAYSYNAQIIAAKKAAPADTSFI